MPVIRRGQMIAVSHQEQQLGIWWMPLIKVWSGWVRFQLPKVPRKSQKLCDGNIVIAEKQDLELKQRLVHFRNRGTIEGARKVDVSDLGPDTWTDRLNRYSTDG